MRRLGSGRRRLGLRYFGLGRFGAAGVGLGELGVRTGEDEGSDERENESEDAERRAPGKLMLHSALVYRRIHDRASCLVLQMDYRQ